MRYRYALFADGRVECFEDRYQACFEFAKKGATAISVHSFSRDIRYDQSSVRVWGDLHLVYFENEEYEDALLKLQEKGIPSNSLDRYELSDSVEIAVPECLCGVHVGLSERALVDEQVRRHFGCRWPESYVCNFGSQNVVFSEALVECYYGNCRKHKRVHSLGRYKPVSLLAELFFNEFRKLHGGSWRYKTGHLTRCSVLSEFLASDDSISYEEVKLLKSLTHGKFSSLPGLALKAGRADLINDPKFLRDASVGYDGITLCSDVPNKLEKIGSKISCRGYCGVTVPSALPFMRYHPDLEGRKQRFGAFVLNQYGLFKHERGDLICPPIWVKECLSGISERVAARTIIFYDFEGCRQELTVDEKDLGKPKFFDLLHCQGFEYPTGKTEKGLLRNFLVQQYPKQCKRQDAIAVDESGWYKDGFVPPRFELKASSYKLKSVLLPPESAGNLRLAKFDHKANWGSEEELAAYFSLIAPLLGLIKHKGICFHFYGSSKWRRDSILDAVNYAWGDWLVPKVCSADDVSKFIVALKNMHKDLPLCVREVGSSDKAQKKMRTFLRRYFLGRKGADGGVRGVVISTGEETLVPEKDRRLCRNGYVFQNDVLLISIPIGAVDFSAYEKLPAGFGQMSVQKIKKDKGSLVEIFELVHNVFKRELKRGKTPKVFAEIVRILSMIYCVERYLVGDNAVSDNFVVSDAALRRCMRCVRDLDFETSFFMQSAQTLNRTCGQILSTGFSYDAFSSGAGASILSIFVETKSYIIVPADEFKKIWGDGFPFSAFTEWLKKKKVLVSFKNQGVCGVQHFPKLKKSVRSYKINKKRLTELTRG
ncbi:hypothetical protein [Maridesulfovibrio sp.]|uniref:hypothetical protein n=1 Tax=Maridesulfovibrio sp. TaxID=2795000 RepID=UPI0039EFE3F7